MVRRLGSGFRGRTSRPTMQRRNNCRTCKPATSFNNTAVKNSGQAAKPAAAQAPAQAAKPATAAPAKASNPFNVKSQAPASKPGELQQVINKASSGYGTPVSNGKGKGTYEQAALAAAQKMNPQLDQTVQKLEQYVKGDEFTNWFNQKLDKDGLGSVTGENRPKFEQEVNKKIEDYMQQQGMRSEIDRLGTQYGNSEVMGRLPAKEQAHAQGRTLISRIAQNRPNGMIGRAFHDRKSQTEATARGAMSPVIENYVKAYIGQKLQPTIESRLTNLGTQHTLNAFKDNVTDTIGSAGKQFTDYFNPFKNKE